MTDIVDLAKARLNINVGKAYRNWIGKLGEDFGASTRLCHISDESLRFLAGGAGNSPFYLYDLIMNLQDLGSGFEFNDLDPKNKMIVMDRHLFLLDNIRFEYMKRIGWLDSYSGEETTIVEFVLQFDQLAPGIHARPPVLSMDHPAYSRFCEMDQFEKEELIRKLIGEALQELRDYPTTL